MTPIKLLAKLKLKKYREAERLFLAEGENLVREAPISPAFLFDDAGSVRRLSTLTTPTGPVAVFPFLDVTPYALLRRTGRVVLLHGLQDPGNVGTIIRTAHAFEAGVALSRGCADLYNPKTVRATMGSIFHAPIARELDSQEFIELARAKEFTPVAAIPEGGVSSRTLPTEKLLLVVGTEGSGLPDEIIASCHLRITVPAQAPSLNAAVAASILLYEAYARVLP